MPVRFRFLLPFPPENPQTDWDGKPRLPSLVLPVRFGFLWPFSNRNTRNGLGLPKLVIPVRFGFFGPFRPAKPRKGLVPGLSSQSVSGFFLFFYRQDNHETDWDDKPGFPRLVLPVRFKFSWPFSAPKRTGMMTSLGFPGLSSQSVSGFLGPFWPENPETDWNDKPGLPRFVIPIRFGFFGPFRPENLKRTCVTSPRFPDCPGTNLSQHDYIAGGGGVPVRLAGLILRFLHRPIPAPITGKHVRVAPVSKRRWNT